VGATPKALKTDAGLSAALEEKSRGTTNMPTKEQATSVDQDSRTSRGQNLDQAGKPTKFVFDAALSTAVAANGQPQKEVSNPTGPLTPDMLDKMNRYWRAANYLCIGQIYLFENPLLREPLKAEQISEA
jgi:hypothetical protein